MRANENANFNFVGPLRYVLQNWFRSHPIEIVGTEEIVPLTLGVCLGQEDEEEWTVILTNFIYQCGDVLVDRLQFFELETGCIFSSWRRRRKLKQEGVQKLCVTHTNNTIMKRHEVVLQHMLFAGRSLNYKWFISFCGVLPQTIHTM